MMTVNHLVAAYFFIGSITAFVVFQHLMKKIVRKARWKFPHKDPGNPCDDTIEQQRRYVWYESSSPETVLLVVSSFLFWPFAWCVIFYESTERVRDSLREKFINLYIQRPEKRSKKDDQYYDYRT
jgi:hypothetical protein